MQHKALQISNYEHSANKLVEYFNEGWVIVDKLPCNNPNESTSVYQWYILGRTEAAKQLYEKSSK